MDYLLLQILLFLILAAVVGFFIGWATRGFGFESRLLVSENQWRSKHHALQNENNRLQSDLDQLSPQANNKHSENFALESTQNEEVSTIPFMSNKNVLPKPEKVASESKSHPLDRLRNELSQIEEAHTQKVLQTQQQTELFESTKSIPPENLEQLDGTADDLKQINGIGPKIESTLNQLGVYHYEQIAEFTEGNIHWINEQMDFSGRVERENWVEQARELIKPVA